MLEPNQRQVAQLGPLALFLLLLASSVRALNSTQDSPARTGSRAAAADHLVELDDWVQECLSEHNQKRRLHQAQPLVLDKKISQYARWRAKHIASTDGAEFEHLQDTPYGENLAWRSVASTSCRKLVRLWYDEIKDYDFSKPGFSHETGHFTAMVWRNTKRLGCARAISKGPRGGVYLVCNYDPPGNVIGREKANVHPASLVSSDDSSASTKAPSSTTRKINPADVTPPIRPSTSTTSYQSTTTTTPSTPSTTTTTTTTSTTKSPSTTKQPGQQRKKGKRKGRKRVYKKLSKKKIVKKKKIENKNATTTVKPSTSSRLLPRGSSPTTIR